MSVELMVSGTIKDKGTDQLISNSVIQVNQAGLQIASINSSDGNYSFVLQVDQIEVILLYFATGYRADFRSININANDTSIARTRTIKLQKA